MKNIISLFLVVLMFASCTERMDIDLDGVPPQLVIYGSISTDATQHRISVMRSSDYFSNATPESISGATVTISDGGNVFVLTESPTEKGVYQTAPDVFGVEGKTYILTVVAAFNGETKEYTAASFLPYSVQVDSVLLQQHSNDLPNTTAVDALLYGTLPNSENICLNVLPFGNDNLPLNDKLTAYSIISDIQQFNPLKLTLRNVEKQSIANLQIQTITKEYADYVLAVQQELRWSIPIFSSPPANVPANISGGAVGFFTAYAIKKK
ncbi:MAG: DUF4249 domain-containing protein [Dysgonamonadaceae bacterium]|jgi:hypothetical protein|nr:DUF4249 domain-containing protein [Dysgonamonadaceae bacterium]